jgi:hypothetical protein
MNRLLASKGCCSRWAYPQLLKVVRKKGVQLFGLDWRSFRSSRDWAPVVLFYPEVMAMTGGKELFWKEALPLSLIGVGESG